VIWLIVLLAVVVVLLGAAAAVPRARSASLKQRFGSEYDRVLDEEGDRRGAEATLRKRIKQRDELEIRELTPEQSARYAERWYVIQARFVDNPSQTLVEAAELVTQVMRERGYPDDATNGDSDYVSIDYPKVAVGYQAAEAVRTSEQPASVDDQRQAIQSYRSLFDELLIHSAGSVDGTAESAVEHGEHNVS
jgi:hypothetical protein